MDQPVAQSRYQELVNTMLSQNDWFEFEGDDYCEDCPGWDGFSNRCECGNRRVDWVYDEICDRVYPEAY